MHSPLDDHAATCDHARTGDRLWADSSETAYAAYADRMV